MVNITKTAATNVSFRARTTTGAALSYQGTTLPVVRQDVRSDAPIGVGVCIDATRAAFTGLAFADMTPLGHPAWSPPL